MQQTPAGNEIPVPTREEVFRDLAKVARAKPPESSEDDSDDRDGGAAQQ